VFNHTGTVKQRGRNGSQTERHKNHKGNESPI